ncbi:helix-turn-helix domain-containing protein [uncultured Thiohalocapsa sp.]|uniref:helix-turn-helix domain-containing protein n=1 Tax=uncultured Thiohalocapsa sp. TaxID=768990 RepID=UPI0025D67256|nr:helix-turn-helix domain-containing protein [uncultured Thiohalocapsa sp.]
MSHVYARHPSPPSDEEALLAAESSRKLAAIIGKDDQAQLCVFDSDEKFVVPVSVIPLLADILNQMAQGNAVSVVPIGHTLTTQQAADLLNVSRPFLVKLLETGKIPFTKVGRHRRIRYQDLMAYMEQMDAQSRASADALTQSAQELGLGY